MYTIKGGWAVQTFALAKCNESEGRKSRIRRSKEERKAMVESFIKKYQSSNNGSFPSLNLTHKEVGGSFYTVREIVREVIQENRVLGPAKLTPEERTMLNADQLLEQYPLGSISYEPQIPLAPSPNGTCFGPHHQSTNGHIINGSQVELKSEEAEDVKCTELQASNSSEAKKNDEEDMVASKAEVNLLVSEPSEAKENLKDRTCPPKAKVISPEIESLEAKENLEEKTVPSKAKVDPPEVEPSEAKENLEEEMVGSKASMNPPVAEPSEVNDNLEEKSPASKTKVNPLPAEAIVETFPLRPTTNSSDSLDAMSGDVKDSTISFEKPKAEDVELGSTDISSTNSIYKSVLVSEVDAENDGVVHNSQGDTNVETYEPNNDEAMVFHNDMTEANDQSQTVAGVKAINAPNGAPTKYPKEASKESKAIVSGNKAEVKSSCSSKKANNPTLDRINLETWEGPSKTSAQNPLLAIFKAFVTAFMKLWSE